MSKALTYQRAGDAAWMKMAKINADLFALSYGAMVMQLINDFEDLNHVNRQLDLMGYNIGVRLIDEFLAKSNIYTCQDFKDTVEAIAKVGFRMFLGINVETGEWNKENTACSLIIYDNPLAEFVELPPNAVGVLWYSNILAGIIRGSLESIQINADVKFTKDVLQGDDFTEIRLELKGLIEEKMGDDYREN